MNKIIIADKLIRVDQFVSSKIDDLTREEIKKLIKENKITVNNKKIKPSYLLKEGDIITIELPEKEELKPVNLNLEVVYEDQEILVIYKPRGLVVHPSSSVKENTLVNHLLYHSKNLSKLAGKDRPGIVHRLDKDTSGLLVVAKTDNAYLKLAKQFQNNTVKRLYETICYGSFTEQTASIEMPIKRDEKSKIKMAVDSHGKHALTHLKIINQNENYSYLECQLITGRTHQIRVHLSYIDHPIVGDYTYGKKDKLFKDGHLLHAKKLEFIHPSTNKKISFSYPLPTEFNEVLIKLKLK